MRADKRQAAHGAVSSFSSRSAHRPAHIFLARNCSSYDYAPAGAHQSVAEFTADCIRHEARIFPLTGFASPTTIAAERTCVEYLVAGNAGLFGSALPSVALLDFHDRALTSLGINASADVMGTGGVLILVKTTVPRIDVHMEMDAALALAEVLRSESSFRVVVRPNFSPEDSLYDQITTAAAFEHVILPGGGAGFLSMLLARGTHVIIPPYAAEETKFIKASCFARVTLLPLLASRTFDVNAVLAAIKSPPLLEDCDLFAYQSDMSISVPEIHLT